MSDDLFIFRVQLTISEAFWCMGPGGFGVFINLGADGSMVLSSTLVRSILSGLGASRLFFQICF